MFLPVFAKLKTSVFKWFHLKTKYTKINCDVFEGFQITKTCIFKCFCLKTYRTKIIECFTLNHCVFFCFHKFENLSFQMVLLENKNPINSQFIFACFRQMKTGIFTAKTFVKKSKSFRAFDLNFYFRFNSLFSLPQPFFQF